MYDIANHFGVVYIWLETLKRHVGVASYVQHTFVNKIFAIITFFDIIGIQIWAKRQPDYGQNCKTDEHMGWMKMMASQHNQKTRNKLIFKALWKLIETISSKHTCE